MLNLAFYRNLPIHKHGKKPIAKQNEFSNLLSKLNDALSHISCRIVKHLQYVLRRQNYPAFGDRHQHQNDFSDLQR